MTFDSPLYVSKQDLMDRETMIQNMLDNGDEVWDDILEITNGKFVTVQQHTNFTITEDK